MDAPILEVQDLCVAYGKVEALHHVSLTVRAGEIVTVIGPNGAGKTTLLSAIMGVLPRSSGTVAFLGTEQADVEVERMVAMGMTLVPEKRELFGDMSVEDNLLLGAFMRRRLGHRDEQQTMAEVFGIFPRLMERRGQRAATLSGGERQMLAVGRALMAKPRLLMLDEPSLGLAPLIVREIWRIIGEIRQSGIASLIVDRNFRSVLAHSDRAVVLEKGRIVMEDTAAALVANVGELTARLGV